MTDSKCYRLNVRLLEDLHTGTGTGRGDVDAMQMRDRRGQPVIRDSHIRGLLLAAGEELMRFDPGIKVQLQALLGKRGGQRRQLRMTALRLTAESRAQTLLWTSTARQAGSRQPSEDTLRVVEHIAAGSWFAAELRVPETLEGLLRRLVERVDRLGSDRTRGGGLITASLDETSPGRRAPTLVTGKVLRLRLRNLEPLCLPATGHPGNLIQSLPFVRGQVLRGALMAWALARSDQAALATLGVASVGDALPIPSAFNNAALARMYVLPMPLSILTPKASGGRADLPWWIEGGSGMAAYDDLEANQMQAGEKPKRPGSREFIARAEEEAAWLRYSPSMRVHMRNQTADLFDAAGQPLPEPAEPELFSMEEIAEDTYFVADLSFPDQPAAERFAKHFAAVLSGGQWLDIGREGRPLEVADLAFMAPAAQAASVRGDSWTLTLTADLVARGKRLGFLTDLDPSALIGLSGRAPEDFPGWEEWQMRGFAETERLHGFNAASGLRRVPAQAIRRGSCWRITGAGSSALAAALALRSTLGERAEEGCGRFALDLQPLAVSGRPASEQALARENRSEERLLAVERIVATSSTLPSLSQLQWLRGRALAATRKEQIVELLREIEAIPDRRPKGGAAWKPFPLAALRREIDRLPELAEKRLLISQLVQWLAPRARDNAEEQRA